MATEPNSIRTIYSAWMAAIRDKDVAALDRIVAPEFRYTDNIRGNKRRELWMQAALAYEMVSFAFPAIEIVDHGDVAVAFLQYRQEAKLQGETRSGQWLITDVWRRRDDDWQVVARSAILQPAQ